MLTKELKALAKQAASVKVHKIKQPKEDHRATPTYESYPPTIYLNDKQAPFISGWEPGKEYTLLVRAKMESKDVASDGKAEHCSGRFVITQIAALNQGKK